MAPSSALTPTVDSDRERSGWDALSLLRFLLAFVVAVGHLDPYAPLGPLRGVENLGSFEAILGFLLISGYSIGHSIQKKPEGFTRRRMLRIYPVYLAAVVLTFLIERNPLTWTFAWHFLANLFFLGQLLVRYSYVDAAWSLDLEVWLYCLAPLLLRARARLLELFIAGSLACYVFYTCTRSLFHFPHYAGTIGGVNLPCLAFIWIAGFYLSTAVGKVRPLFIAGALFAVHLGLATGIELVHQIKHHDLPAFFTDDLPGYAANGLLLLVVFMVFWGVIHHWFLLGLGTRRVFRFLGDISYPLYLVHFPAFHLLGPYTSNAGLLLGAALLMATGVYFGCDFYSRRRRLA